MLRISVRTKTEGGNDAKIPVASNEIRQPCIATTIGFACVHDQAQNDCAVDGHVLLGHNGDGHDSGERDYEK